MQTVNMKTAASPTNPMESVMSPLSNNAGANATDIAFSYLVTEIHRKVNDALSSGTLIDIETVIDNAIQYYRETTSVEILSYLEDYHYESVKDSVIEWYEDGCEGWL